MNKGDKVVVLPSPKRLGLYGAATISVWLLIWCLQIAKGGWLFDTAGRPAVSNFLCFWSAGQMALNGQATSTYDWDSVLKVELSILGPPIPEPFTLPWLYPPTFLLATACLALLPYFWSCLAWLLVTGIGYVAAIRAILPHRLAVVLALAAPGMLLNVLLMETGFAVAALAGTALLLLETRPILAGVALGALTFKPQFGLLFPLVLVLTGRWRVIFSAAATTLLLAGLAALVFGVDPWRAYLQQGSMLGTVILGGEADRQGWYSDVQAWYSVARYLGAGSATAWTVYAVTAGGCAAVISWLWRRSVPYNFKAASLAVGSVLVTPYIMTYDTVLLVAAVAFLVKESMATGFRRGDIEIYFLVLSAPLYPLAINGIVPLLPAVYSGLLAWIVLRARTVGASLDLDIGVTARLP